MKKVKKQLNTFEQVYEIIKSIPRAKVLTYGIISLMMNRRISAAAVGWALNGLANKKDRKYSMETVPWFRVVNAQGKISTKFPSNVIDKNGQPVKLQRILLENEGILFNEDGSIELSRYLFLPGKKMTKSNEKKRCFGTGNSLYEVYHDTEWAVPSHDDQHLFQMLILEGAQAGLSWETVLKKRSAYKKAFHNFNPKKVATMTDAQLHALTQNPDIIRNRLKIFSARKNAQAFLRIQKEFGSFDAYLWEFVDGKPIINHWKHLKDAPTTTAQSDALSKDLKKRGMSFVGSTIIYAFMQAVGMVNDHSKECWRHSTH